MAPADAAQNCRAAGLTAQAEALVGAVFDDKLQGRWGDELRPDLGGKCAEVDGLFLLGQSLEQCLDLLQPGPAAIGAVGQGVGGGEADILVAAGVFGDDRNRSVAHAGAEEARRLAVSAAPGAAARDLDGRQDLGEGRIRVQVHRRPLFRESEPAPGICRRCP